MKYILVAFFVLFLVQNNYSQVQTIPDKKIYQSADGKIFVNKSLPLYFKISESKNPNAEHKLLISHTTPKITNPVYLAKEGLNIFYSPWAVDTTTKQLVYPKKNVVFELYADGTPPKTSVHNNIISYEKTDSLYFGKNLKIWFSATDATSGVEQTYISVNGEPYSDYLHDTLTFEHGLTYTIKYYSTDYVGNYEKEQSITFTIDTTRPLTNLVVTGSHIDNIISDNCKVSLKPQDAFSGTAKTYYYIDNQAKKVYTTPINVSNLREGRHILHYFTKDNVNNIENEKSYEFFIDRTPPMLIDEIIGDYVYVNGKAYTSGRSQIQLTAIDNRAGVKAIYYSYDCKDWTLYDKPFYLPANQDNVKIYYYAEDNVGNKTQCDINNSSSTKLFASQMDLTPPDLKHRFSSPVISLFDTVYISDKTSIILYATDDLSGLNNISYQVDNEQSVQYSTPFKYNNNGYHKITYFGFDKVNNMATDEFYVMVDTVAPEIFVNFSYNPFIVDNKEVYPKGTKVFIASTDDKIGVRSIKYQINNSSEKLYSNYLTFNTSGNYSVTVKSYDNLGNEGIKVFNFIIK